MFSTTKGILIILFLYLQLIYNNNQSFFFTFMTVNFFRWRLQNHRAMLIGSFMPVEFDTREIYQFGLIEADTKLKKLSASESKSTSIFEQNYNVCIYIFCKYGPICILVKGRTVLALRTYSGKSLFLDVVYWSFFDLDNPGITIS